MLSSKIYNRYVVWHHPHAADCPDLWPQRAKVVIWLYDNIEMRIEGRITVRVLLEVPNILKLYRHSIIFFLPRASWRRLFLIYSFPNYGITILITLTTQGFDEFMNVVLDEAAEVYVKEAKPRRELGEWCAEELWIPANHLLSGRILLKGDNITLIQQVV